MLSGAAWSQATITNLFFNSSNNITQLNFSTPTPTVSYTGIGGGFEGIAHAEDGVGNIIFMVNATGVYRMPGGVLMPGSAGILANTSSAEMVVVPIPGQASQYYVIYNAQTCSALYYCIVDMTLAGGLGDILPGSLNTLISNNQYSEGLEIVRQGSGCSATGDYWLVAYRCGVGFDRWTVSASGITNQTSLLPFNANASGGNYDGRGELDYHNGRIGLACTYTTPSFLADFDALTGTMTNPITINTPGTGFSAGAYGIEFSPDGTKAYFTDWYNSTGSNNLFIYDFTTGLQKDTVIPTPGGSQGLGEIEMGKDGKLYSLIHMSNQIAVINNPNDPPTSLTWSFITLTTGVSMGLGISDHIQSDLFSVPQTNADTLCINQPTWLFAPSYVDSVTWLNNVGAIVSTVDSFLAPTVPMTYTITGLDSCNSLAYSSQVYVGYVDSAITAIPTDICVGDSVSLSTGIGQRFTWTPATGLACPTCQSTMAGPTVTTTYHVLVEDTIAGCSKTDSVVITVRPQPTAVIDAEADQCFNFHNFDLSQSGSYGPTATFSWQMPGGSPNSSTAENPTGVTYGSTGTKMVTLTVVDDGCVSDPDTITFVVNPNPNAAISNTGDTLCFGETTTLSTGTATTYQWTPALGLSSTVNQTVTATPPATTTYQVISTNLPTGCADTSTVNIWVYPLPVASIPSVANQCVAGNSFNFTQNGTYGPGATFNWQFPNGTPSSSNAEFPTGISFATPGTYFATLQVEENNCVSNVDTVTFVVYPMPNPAFTTPSGPQCFDVNSYNFTSTGSVGPGVSHSWTFQNGTPGTSSLQNPNGITFSAPGWNTIIHQVTENGCISVAEDSVLIYANPVVDAGPDVSFCEGAGGAQLLGTILSSGTTLNWPEWWCDSVNVSTFCGLDSVYDLDPIASPNASTWYYLQVTDNNGCKSNIDSAFVTVLPLPIVDAGPDAYICGDSAPGVLLTPNITGAPGPYHYQWIPSTGLNNDTLANPYARPDTTTIYVLVVQSANGCYSQYSTVDTLSSVTVHVQPIPVADAGPDRDLCLGDSLMLQGFGYGAGPQYNFEWSPATGLSSTTISNPMAGPTATTEYILTAWSNGCPSYGDTVRVNVHTNPTASAGPQTDVCLGESTVLQGSASGDSTAVYSYSWSPAGSLDNPNSANPVATPDTTTTYTLIASTQYGCESPPVTVTIVVRPTPVAEAGPQQTICEGDSVQLMGGYYYTTTDSANPSQIYFAWTPSTGLLSDSTVTNPWVNPTQSGFYYLQVRHNTCETLDSVLVTVVPGLNSWVDADTGITCAGGSVQLSAGGGLGGASFQWIPSTGLSDPNISNPVATPGTSTVYSVIISEGGCSDTLSVPLEILPMPEAAILSSVREGCPDFTVSFLDASSNGIHWIWNFGDGQISNQQNPSHTYTQPGEYQVTLTTANIGGCKAASNPVIIRVADPGQAEFTANPELPAMVSLPNTAIQFLDQSLRPNAWRWEFGDGRESAEQNPVHAYNQPGEYMITLTTTTPEGCQTSVTHGPVVVYTPDLFIPNVFTPNADGVNDGFLVQYTGSQPFQINIYDRWGVMLFSSKNKTEAWDGTTGKGEAVAEGTYYYTVTIGGKDYTGNVTLLR